MQTRPTRGGHALILLRILAASACFVEILGAGAAHAQEVTLRAVSSFAEGTTFSKNFERFVQKVNAEGKGLVQINYIGGPKAVPPFEVGNAVKSGVVDVANVTGAFYTTLLPEADALKLNTISAAEMRKNGAYDYINKLWSEKMNVQYLARSMDHMPFCLYLNKKIDKPDLTGLKLRITPVYRDFFQALGATIVQTAPGEVYTALERNVIDGYGWPISGIFDLGWHEKTKYRVSACFYNVEVGVLVSNNAWNKLNDKQREFLTRMGVWMEGLSAEMPAHNAGEAKRQAAAGIQVIDFGEQDRASFVARAYEVGWASAVKQSPQHGPKLKSLITR